MSKSTEIQKKLDDLQTQLTQTSASFRKSAETLLGWNDSFLKICDAFKSTVLSDAKNSLKATVLLGEARALGLRPVIVDEALQAWQPTEAAILPATIPFGQYRHQKNKQVGLPAEIPFVGNYRGIILSCNNQTAPSAREVFLSLLLRTVFVLPQRVRYFLIDPANSGNAFISVAGSLSHRGETTGDACTDLKKVQEGFHRIQSNFLNPRADSFEKLDPATQASEKLQLVFVADFPKRFDRRAIEMLQAVATNGPQNGTYVFVEWNKDHPLPAGMKAEELTFDPATIVDLCANANGEGGDGFEFLLDKLPDSESMKSALDRAREMERQDVGVIAFTDHRILPPPEKWWSQSSIDYIETSIGLRGAHDTIDLWFGSRQQTTCAHGIIAGSPGSGKSVFLHVLICGLAARYSPEELRMYIIDMKEGVELAPYHKLPHTAVISSNSSPELARSILGELSDELSRRYELFKSTGAQSLADYRRMTGAEKLPRILLLIDEYQGIFNNDREGLASQLLKQLAEKGRAAGIQILLASQKYEAAGMEHADAIFNCIPLRLGLKLESDQIDRQQMFGTSTERSLLKQCDVAGKIVVRSPDIAECFTGRVAMLEVSQRSQLLQQLATKAIASGISTPAPIILDGLAEPELLSSPFIRELIDNEAVVSDPVKMAALVKCKQQGLGESSWLHEDHPTAFVIGKSFSVRGYASFVFRRRSGDNALIVSAEHDMERYGILVAITSSAILQKRAALHLEILDFAQPQTRWHGSIAAASIALCNKYGSTVNVLADRRLAEESIEKLSMELDRRKGLGDAELMSEKTVLIILSEPERVQCLHRSGVGISASDSPTGAKFRRIYHEGPLLGIHVVISVGSASSLWQILDRRMIELFRYRICLQIDEKSSFDLLGSPKAANLNRMESKPVRALLYDQQRNAEVVFKPYICHGPETGIVSAVIAMAKVVTKTKIPS